MKYLAIFLIILSTNTSAMCEFFLDANMPAEIQKDILKNTSSGKFVPIRGALEEHMFSTAQHKWYIERYRERHFQQNIMKKYGHLNQERYMSPIEDGDILYIYRNNKVIFMGEVDMAIVMMKKNTHQGPISIEVPIPDRMDVDEWLRLTEGHADVILLKKASPLKVNIEEQSLN